MPLDLRIAKWIEAASGQPLETFPDEGFRICVSRARTDAPKNRLLVQRISGKHGVLVTVIPRLFDTVKECLEELAEWELFSPFGLAEIKRALPPSDAASLDEIYGLDYFLTGLNNFRPVKPRHAVTALKKKDIPPGDEKLRLNERRSTEKDDFTWAFACYHDDPSVPAVNLPEYGPQCAAVAVFFWKGDDIAGLGVGTEEALRGQGYALDAVSVATRWILDQGGVAWYGAYSNNISSLRIPRRLGYTLVHSSFGA